MKRSRLESPGFRCFICVFGILAFVHSFKLFQIHGIWAKILIDFEHCKCFLLLGERWMIWTTLEVEVDRLMTFRQVFKEIALSIYIYLQYTYIYCVNIFIEMYIYIYVHLCCRWDILLYIYSSFSGSFTTWQTWSFHDPTWKFVVVFGEGGSSTN